MESNPLTAVEFFARRMSGCSLTDAHRATGIAYTTIHDLAHAHVGTPRIETLRKLEAWSRAVAASGMRNVRVFRRDPGGEVLLSYSEDRARESKWHWSDARRGEPVDQHTLQSRAERGLL